MNQTGGAQTPNGSITILDEDNITTEGLPITLAQDLDHPIAAIVADFNQDGLPDIAVLCPPSNGTSFIKVFQNTSNNTTVSFDSTLAPIALGNVTSVAMASANFAPSDPLPDIVVVNSNQTVQVLKNITKINIPPIPPGPITFDIRTVFNLTSGGVPGGVPVGVATGNLHGDGTTTPWDIAVAYRRQSDNESMVAVLRNTGTDGFTFVRTTPFGSPSGQQGDFDAGRKNPTAIAVGNLNGSLWDDIVVTNNEVSAAGIGLGSVSVLLSQATPGVSDFTIPVNVANPAAIDHLTATLAADVQTNLANLSATLFAPNGQSITLFTNQTNLAGQVISPNIGIAGNALGILGFTTGATGNPGTVFGTTFDDNATRNIFDLNPALLNGAACRPQLAERPRRTLATSGPSLIQQRGHPGHLREERRGGSAPPSMARGPWRSRISAPPSPLVSPLVTSESSTSISHGNVGRHGRRQHPHSHQTRSWSRGALTGNLPHHRAVHAQRRRPGPGHGHRQHAGARQPLSRPDLRRLRRLYQHSDVPNEHANPTTNTDIFLAYSDNGGRTWSLRGHRQ